MVRLWTFLWAAAGAGLWSSAADALGAPLLGPEIMSFGSLPPLSLWHNGAFPLVAAAPVHSGLPAPKGTEFDGPDPGLNAAIINVPVDPCPNGYRRDMNEKCRLMFGYGPNPFHSFIPENYKGDLQFYMGIQVGGPRPNRRRGRGRGRPRPARLKNNSAQKKTKQQGDDDDD
ncbi:uncharacterized protein LOC127002984 isoform X2 [Eriocheir sinensis]|uniref:uncharacterized protein LOC127002984 isoform X2 n=1 Tax=Eriocheir sinensis TaxID=95602 RepID=UPI0021C90D13|nr:uncharacterized protein LOC127002984 isoform X2 [Eriocheir sinensis]